MKIIALIFVLIYISILFYSVFKAYETHDLSVKDAIITITISLTVAILIGLFSIYPTLT